MNRAITAITITAISAILLAWGPTAAYAGNGNGNGIEVDIDIKPGSDPNSINPQSRGVISVAILGSDTFDATTVDVDSLEFGPAGATPTHPNAFHLEDVNDDGFTDLVSHYRIQQTGIAAGDSEACLTGETLGGDPFEACDDIITHPV